MIYILTMNLRNQVDCGADGRFIAAYANEEDALKEAHDLKMRAICARNLDVDFVVLEEEIV